MAAPAQSFSAFDSQPTESFMISEDEQLKARLLERTRRMLEARVEEVMTTDVVSVDWNDLTARAARLCLELQVLGVLVMKDGRAANMVTSHDLLRLGYEEVFDENRDYLRMKVGDLVAEKEFVTARPGALLRDVLNLMVDKRVRSVPIIQDGYVHGILSMTDMMRWYRKTHDEVRTGQLPA